MGAGLGGGSSNAAAVLTGLNTLAGHRLAPEALERVAAQLGSDCVLFLASQPVVMRGRGERIERLSESVAQRLRGTRLLLFKPDFGISTVWAYRQMAAGAPHTYLPAPDAESRLRAWLDSPTAPVSELLFNNMERPAFTKFPALPALLERLKGEFGLAVGMSGSGSACYAILSETTPVAAVLACIHESWGPETFAVETRVR
jgi:4-diphosphocytidyl-2-C-methyl-D-erythritol kinase